MEIIDVNSKKVIVIHVPVADRRDRPVYLNGNMDRGTYKRNHEGDYRCRIEEVLSMHRDSHDDDSDGEIVPGVSVDDCMISEDIEQYISMLKGRDPQKRWANIENDEILQLIGAIRKDADGIHPTCAGLLMFGKVSCILRSFPDYHLDYREIIGDKRWTYRINSDDPLVNMNIFTFVRATIERISSRIGLPFKLTGFVRDADSETLASVRGNTGAR